MLRVLEWWIIGCLWVGEVLARLWAKLPGDAQDGIAGVFALAMLGVMIGVPIGGSHYWSTGHYIVMCVEAPESLLEEMREGQEQGRIILLDENFTPYTKTTWFEFSALRKDMDALLEFGDWRYKSNLHCSVVGEALGE